MKAARQNSGFTLAEIMIAVILLAVVSSMVMTTFLMFNRISTNAIAYRAVHVAGRRVVTLMASDVREARTAAIDPNGSLSLVQSAPAVTVRYTVDGKLLKRSVGDTSRIVSDGIEDLHVQLMDADGKEVPGGNRVRLVRTRFRVIRTLPHDVSQETFTVVTALRNPELQ